MTPLATARTTAQQSFESPESGVTALVEAVKANDQALMISILGPHSGKLISSGDEVADAQNREKFIEAYGQAHKIVLEGDTKAALVIGADEWPLPIPLVESHGKWRFDSAQGKKEILARRIGANELAAIKTCLAIVDAQREYAEQDRDGEGVPHYADRFASTPGKRDGLYWETNADEPPSPLGPLLAAAASEGYTKSAQTPLAPYHGYYYRILTGQGPDARGGAYDYIVNGKMIGGFAVLAYPARYGASGIMTFMVGYDGVVYEKNLGKKTAELAAEITRFNPDATWNQNPPD
jgi:hypothetical protein